LRLVIKKNNLSTIIYRIFPFFYYLYNYKW
jgi:hypothetical protein